MRKKNGFRHSSIDNPKGFAMKDNNHVFLIVDDEKEMCWVLEHILKSCGILAETAYNGQDAIDLVEQRRFPLAFIDIKLPDIEGLELARQMRRVDPSIRVIIISGYYYRQDKIIQQALNEGLICDFIGKPFDNRDILSKVEATRPDVLLGACFP